ncbi:hypothetical protein GCM10007854_18870 [Algimonas porphyrae]|uniref:Uncharacterized protein n=1 Tax=Algimonas porphyrae TaxID=1128113 RepID=A0ABQ5V3U0_9PROT|nr:hypothetical protein GCM10007854_18870 [Algimonas porphyrae]
MGLCGAGIECRLSSAPTRLPQPAPAAPLGQTQSQEMAPPIKSEDEGMKGPQFCSRSSVIAAPLTHVSFQELSGA